MERGDPSGCHAVLLCNFSEKPAAFTMESGACALWTGTPPEDQNGGIIIGRESAALYLAKPSVR